MMGVGRCGICGAPTLTGAICQGHWGRLVDVMGRAAQIYPDLTHGGRRHGEITRRSTAVPLPISVPVMEARTALSDAVVAAVGVICPGVPRLVTPDGLRLLWAHRARLRGSYAAPVLLADLEPAVAQAVAAIDIPRGRMSVPGRCRDCGPGMMHPVQGVLACDRCGVHHSVGEVRALM